MKISLLVFMVILSVITYSQDIPVTFQVDMSMQIFDGNFPPGANVAVRGSFQTDAGDPNGNWQGNLFQLSDSDDDSIYTGTFPMSSILAGNSYIFKYVIVNPPAGDNWEYTLDRPFTLTSPATVIPLDCFNHDCEFSTPSYVTNTINFTADISSILGVGINGAFDPYQDSLLVMGLDWNNLGRDIIGNRRMENTDPFSQGIYTTTLTVTNGSAAPNGVGDSTKWKFKAFPNSRFQNNGWEMTTDRWHIYQANGTIITLPLIVPRIFPITDTTTIDVDLTINVDMLGAVNRYNGLPISLSDIEFVGMRGVADFLGNWNMGGCWCVNDTITGSMKVLTQVSTTLWSYHVIIPAGSGVLGAYEYKFAAMYPGADTVNGGINPLDNEFGFGSNHVLLLSNTPAIIKNHCFGCSDPYNVEKLDDILPEHINLEQNYPNPFNPTTKIRYSIPEHSSVTLKVFNLLGEELETLVNSEQSTGVYEAAFDASNLSSGIYFYTLQTRDYKFTRKMMLLK